MTISSYQTLIKAPGPNAPIVFALHGMGGDEYQFAELTRQILPDAGVISPRGDVSEFGALRFFRRTERRLLRHGGPDLANRKDGQIHCRPQSSKSGAANIRARLFERGNHPCVRFVQECRPFRPSCPAASTHSMDPPEQRAVERSTNPDHRGATRPDLARSPSQRGWPTTSRHRRPALRHVTIPADMRSDRRNWKHCTRS